MNRNTRIARSAPAVGLACLLIALSAVSCGSGSGSSRATRWPDVAISDSQGAPMSSASIVTVGRPAVIAIWAVWCRPCREELPRLAKLASTTSGIDVVAMNLGDKPADVNGYLTSLGLKIRAVIDSEGRLTERLGISSVPATVFLDRTGAIVGLHLGALSAEQLDREVAKLVTG